MSIAKTTLSSLIGRVMRLYNFISENKVKWQDIRAKDRVVLLKCILELMDHYGMSNRTYFSSLRISQIVGNNEVLREELNKFLTTIEGLETEYTDEQFEAMLRKMSAMRM